MHEVLGRRRITGVLALLVGAAVWLGVAQAAQAATLFNDGAGGVTWSSSGVTTNQVVDIEKNFDFFTGASTGYSFQAANEATTVNADTGCTPSGDQPAGAFILCPLTINRMTVDAFNGFDVVRNNFCPSGVFCLGQTSVDIPVTLIGRGADDSLEGGTAGDNIIGGPGSDTLIGNGGNDTLTADDDDTQVGSDTLLGGAGNDVLTARAGNDTLVPGVGDDGVLDAGAGTDTVSYDDGRGNGVSVDLSNGSGTQDDGGVDDNATAGQREALVNVERVVGTTKDDTLSGSTAADTLEGGGGSDDLSGGSGNDTLRGQAGADTLDGGNGSDLLDGGADSPDRVDYSSRTSAQPLDVLIPDNTTADDGGAADGAPNARDRLVSIETVIGGAGNDTIRGTGSTTGVTIDGKGGNDTLTGGNGDDSIRGGTGSDTVVGNGGDDTMIYADHTEGVVANLGATDFSNGSPVDGAPGARDKLTAMEQLVGSNANDTLIGDDGANLLQGSGGDDTIRGGGGADSMTGGDGFDVVDYSYSGQPVNVSLNGVKDDGAPGDLDDIGGTFEGIIGGNGGDTLTGNDGNNLLRGGPGNDTMNGLGGADNVFGEADNDSIESRDGVVDAIDCGDGTDTNTADAGDGRVNCELPSTGGGGGTGGGGTGGGTGGATGGGGTTKPLKNFSVTVVFGFLPKHPKKTTKFTDFVANNVPKGSKVVTRCVKKNGKACKGKLKSVSKIKKTKKKSFRLKVFLRKYPAGSILETTISKAGFRNQIKIVTIRKNKVPAVTTKCQAPGKKRKSC